MKSDDDDDVIMVSQRALVSALLEMERQYSLEYYFLSRYLERIEQACHGIHRLMESCRFSAAKDEVVKLLLPQDGLEINDEQFEEWRETFERQWKRESNANKNRHCRT